MKKITFLSLHLNYGGIEKCICDVANLLSSDYEVEILTTYKMIDVPAFYLNDNIKVTYLTDIKPNKNEFIFNLKHLKLFSALKEGIKSLKVLYLKKHTMINALKNSNSDIYISSRIYFNKLLSKYGKNIKIGWEHNFHNYNKKYIKSFISSCKNLDKVVLVSKELKDYYEKLFNEKNIKCKCVYIPNFISEVKEQTTNLNNNLISVGRLSKEKGFSDLIDVFKLLNIDTKLNIIGDGVEKTNLINKIRKYNLDDKIILHGFQNQDYINNLYLDSSIYLMTSYTESFGLVLLEAMSLGVVPIAFDSASGAKEIIKDKYNGYLIKNRDKKEMANTIKYLLNNKDKLKE